MLYVNSQLYCIIKTLVCQELSAIKRFCERHNKKVAQSL